MSQSNMVAAATLKLWREHPSRMVRDLFKVVPDPWQDEILEAFPHHQRIAMRAAKGVGKSTVLAWLCWNFLLTRPEPNIAATSINAKNLEDGLWKEMARWFNVSPMLQEMFEWTKSRIFCKSHPATWWMSARTYAQSADQEQIGKTLAGIHQPYIMFILDESGGMPEAILPTAEAALAGTIEAHIIQAGNPISLSGPLYRACVKSRHLWHVVNVTGDPDDSKRSPRISIEFAREQIQQYGRDNPWVKVGILGQFPDSNLNSLISVDECEAAMKRYYRPDVYQDAPRVIGVDVAAFGDDASVIFCRQGLQSFPMIKKRNITSTQGAGLVARKWDDWNADACFIDNTGGFGAGWIDRLVELGKAPIGVGFANAAHQDSRYYNKRTEMYFDAVEWIKRGGVLPPSPELTAALTQTNYTFKGDRLLLEPKEMIKAKLGYSPDEADSFCFEAGTLIQTPAGPLPIEEFINADIVTTPFGNARVLKKWVTIVNRLTTVEFSDGSQLCGRPEHKIFVYGYGMVRLDALLMTMAISPLSERHLWLKWSGWFIRGRSIGFKSLAGIIPPVSQSSARDFCIAAFGLRLKDRFRQNAKSIIRMMIGDVAKLIILSFSPKLSIGHCIPQNGEHCVSGKTLSSDISIKPERPQEHGIQPLQGWLGIAKMERLLGKIESQSKQSASIAAQNMTPISNHVRDSARFRVRRLWLIVVISRLLDNAWNVVPRFWPINIGRQNVVPVSVQTCDVDEISVYNLTLDQDNAYYANGILVFNCLTFAEPVTATKRIGSAVQRSAVPQNYDPMAEANRGFGLASAVDQSYDPMKF